MLIYYDSDSYISFKITGDAYQERLAALEMLSRQPENADAIIFHHNPIAASWKLNLVPSLRRKYCIGYFIWETDRLPANYRKNLSDMDEIWTASAFSAKAFTPYHQQVHVVPHVSTPPPNIGRAAALACIAKSDVQLAEKLTTKTNTFTFLAMGGLWHYRKNLELLIRVFRRLHRHLPQTRLIVKSTAPLQDAVCKQKIISTPGITIYQDALPRAALGALYALCDVFVSPHCSEGWGLTVADAMALERPVISTGYSGTMTFTNASNAYLIAYEERPILKAHQQFLFHSSMRWAYPYAECLEHLMLRSIREHQSSQQNDMIQRAKQAVDCFSAATIEKIIAERCCQINLSK